MKLRWNIKCVWGSLNFIFAITKVDIWECCCFLPNRILDMSLKQEKIDYKCTKLTHSSRYVLNIHLKLFKASHVLWEPKFWECQDEFIIWWDRWSVKIKTKFQKSSPLKLVGYWPKLVICWSPFLPKDPDSSFSILLCVPHEKS